MKMTRGLSLIEYNRPAVSLPRSSSSKIGSNGHYADPLLLEPVKR